MFVGLLGPVIIVDEGEVSTLEIAKHRALLAVLALHASRVVDTSELVDAIWGDRPPATAAKTLQGYVSALRKEFGAGLVATEPGGYRLGDDVDVVDVIEFERAIELGREHLGGRRPDQALGAFREALGRWRGRPLADLADSPVAAGHLARIDELHALAQEGEIEAELASGHHREVVPDLERLVQTYPYREHAWRLLMLALYRSGRAADALVAFDRARAVLANDLGVEPDGQTIDLRRRIVNHDRSLDAPETGPPSNLPASLDSFVGRDDDLRRLVESMDDRRLIALTGVGGVGKSRLAAEATRSVRHRFPGGSWWIDLAASDPAVPIQSIAAATMGIRVSGRIAAALVATLRRSPTLLVLDNCEHRIDDVNRFATWVTSEVETVWVLATSRTILGVPGCRNVTVGPLDTTEHDRDAAAVELLRDRVIDRGGTNIASADARRIAELVGGIPLGLELAAAQCVTLDASELIDRLGDADTLLSMTDASKPGRHASLGRVLDVGLTAVESPVRSIVARLTVLPGPFDQRSAAAVMGVDHPTADRAIRACLDASVLTRASAWDGTAQYRMLWPIRQHLSSMLTEAERDAASSRHAVHVEQFARHYRVVADTELEAAWTSRAGELEADLRAAGAWCEGRRPEHALVIATASSRAAWLRGDQREAAGALRRALERMSDGPEDLVAWGVEAICWPEFLMGDVEQALHHSLEAIARFERSGDSRGLARALRNRAHALHLGGVGASTTTPIYRRAIEAAEAAGLAYAVALGRVQFAHALTAFEESEVVDVEGMLDRAEDVLREIGDRAALAHAELSRVFLAFGRDDVEGVRAAGEEMMRLSRLARSVIWEQIAAVALGVNAFERHDDAEQEAHFARAVRLAVDTDNEVQLGVALWALAAVRAGALPEAAARLWGAARHRSPLPPLHRRRYGAWIDVARTQLGHGRFAHLEREGARLTTDEVIVLCDLPDPG